MKKIMISCISLALCFSFFTIPMSAKHLDETEIADVLNFDSVSEAMTYDEMVIQIAQDEGKTIEDVEKELGPQTRETRLGTFRTLYQTIVVKSIYRPQLRFYVETSESGSFHGILNIQYVNMNREYEGISRQFSGSVDYVLTDPNNIHYSIDGDFFNNGSTTISLGGTVGLGEYGSVSFSVSSSFNHFAYCSESGDKFW